MAVPWVLPLKCTDQTFRRHVPEDNLYLLRQYVWCLPVSVKPLGFVAMATTPVLFCLDYGSVN
jgi:hypothetical protein